MDLPQPTPACYACDVPAWRPRTYFSWAAHRRVRILGTTSPPPVTVPSWTQRGSTRGARAVLQTFLIFPLMGAFSPLTVIDRYRVKPLKGGAVFVSNHSSALDAVVMLQALPNRFRFRAFVVAAADSIFKRKWEAVLTQLLINTFPIPRAGGARPALDRLKDHLAHRWSVVIFPEGTLSRTGNIGTFKKGHPGDRRRGADRPRLHRRPLRGLPPVPPHPTATSGQHHLRRSALPATGRRLRQLHCANRASRPYAGGTEGVATRRAGAHRLRLSRRLQLLVLT